ncbi:MAG: hypothetical protein ACFE9C_13450 [Candidatus Hodarchaeota archaeon]
MKHDACLFKIGGSILEDHENLNSTIFQLSHLFEKEKVQKIIIIPGGGSFANFIRKVYNELKFTDELAHWMGIISMNYNGLELNKKFPNLELIEDIDELKKKDKIFGLFLPFQFLQENDRLPHTWEVTSDSITLFVAENLGLNRCFLIKDTDGIMDKENQVIKEISIEILKKMKESHRLAEFDPKFDNLKEITRPVDPYLMSLIEEFKIRCIILNGCANRQRILEFFDKSISQQEKIYSIIKY